MKMLHKLLLVLIVSVMTTGAAVAQGASLDKENILYIDTKNGRSRHSAPPGPRAGPCRSGQKTGA